MPIYCYKRMPDGESVELWLSVEEHDRLRKGDTLTLNDGSVLIRDWKAEHGEPRNAGQWPMWSDAAGVSPTQVKEAYEHSVSIGVPTEFHPVTGQAKFESRSHRKKYLERIGMYDRNAGYGDPTPR